MFFLRIVVKGVVCFKGSRLRALQASGRDKRFFKGFMAFRFLGCSSWGLCRV